MEDIELQTRKNLSKTVQAEVIRTSRPAKLGKALAIAVVGLVIGPATIVIPVAHFVTTWAIPLLSILIAIHVYKMGPKIERIVGACPKCDAAIDTEGGTAASDLWIRCPACHEPLHPVLVSSADAGA